jgi:hypothetical protein
MMSFSVQVSLRASLTGSCRRRLISAAAINAAATLSADHRTSSARALVDMLACIRRDINKLPWVRI